MDKIVPEPADSLETISSGRSENLSGSCADERRSKFKRQSIWDQRHAIKLFKSEGFTVDQLKEIWSQVVKKKCDLNSVKTNDDIKKFLREKFALNTMRLVSQVVSDDGNTKRLMLELQDGHTIEAVIIKNGLYSNSNKNIALNTTLCISCQVGNNMDCTFCANGNDGLFANLTSGEILEQLQIASTIEKISKVAFMGMGEPLDNYKEVIAAVKAMIDTEQFGLEARNITISTVGIPERIQTLTADVPGVSLSLAVHSANQDIRENLIPSAMMFSLTEIFQSLDNYLNGHSTLIRNGVGEKVMIEYVLIDGINDSQKDATDLVNLILPRKEYCVINPSLFTPPTAVPSKFKSPSLDSLREFVAVLQSNQLVIGPKYADINEPQVRRQLDTISYTANVDTDSDGAGNEFVGRGYPEEQVSMRSVQYKFEGEPNLSEPFNVEPIEANKVSSFVQVVATRNSGNVPEPDAPSTTNVLSRQEPAQISAEIPKTVIKPHLKSPTMPPQTATGANVMARTKAVINPVKTAMPSKSTAAINIDTAPPVTDRTTARTMKSALMDSVASFTNKVKTLAACDWKECLLECKRNACPRKVAKEVCKQVDEYYEEFKKKLQFLKYASDFWDENVESKYHFYEKYGLGPSQCVMAVSTIIMASTIGLIFVYRSKRT